MVNIPLSKYYKFMIASSEFYYTFTSGDADDEGDLCALALTTLQTNEVTHVNTINSRDDSSWYKKGIGIIRPDYTFILEASIDVVLITSSRRSRTIDIVKLFTISCV
jgi:hypothetical protein